MDVYDVLYNLCLEHKVKYNNSFLPLWKVKEEKINIDDVDLNLPWKCLRELSIYLYELKLKQRDSKELINFDIIKVLVGAAFLKNSESYSFTDSNVPISYLSDILTIRINILLRYYYFLNKPKNTTIFEEIILKFPQKKDLRTNNKYDLQNLVKKLKDFLVY